MERVILVPKSEADWLSMRVNDLTSTECAALFGASPYMTEFELYHVKSGSLQAGDFEANERMKWGSRLESAIAYGIAEDFGIEVVPHKTYGRIPDLRMGSSYDFKVVGIVEGWTGDNSAARDMFLKFGPGNLEIKSVDGLQFKRLWIDEAETIEAPAHIEIQTQHQMEVSDLGWTMIAALVGGNTPKIIFRERDFEVGAIIRQKVSAFWRRVDAGTPPTPDYAKDADTISRLYVNNDGSSADLSDNARLVELCVEYKDAAVAAKVADDRKKAARAEITTIIEAHKAITTNGFNISAGTNKESYRAYRREASEKITITISKIPACDIEATVAPFRNIRITEVAA